jgi:Protein of unknown function (DUF664)
MRLGALRRRYGDRVDVQTRVEPARGIGDERELLDGSLRWSYLYLIKEYARHLGHADLLRERIDGATGE